MYRDKLSRLRIAGPELATLKHNSFTWPQNLYILVFTSLKR